ncbi:uncharacterized protein LOC134864106 isoform X2 [Eleginops maclovinus]|uniref:uncharacterized protein LOC134864106 isoform X2 n=1 Tax=Eleginops maclovinus TaxID=56733 RepID=UPI003080272E
MTAKHRKGKNNYKHEDNFFKNDATETEVRGGGNNIALHLVLFLLIVICGATGSWFCFQQHQTLTYLTDNLMGMQMKIVKLQSSHEEMRQSNSQQVSESLEIRLNALEDSYALAQKQVGMALATAEQLRTSDLPAQVMSLHTEMKNRLAEMQQATVSLEQLSQLQSMLMGKSEEFEVVRIQVEGLSTLSHELSQKVEGLTGSMVEAESKLEERVGEVATLSASLDGQASEVQRLKQQLESYQAQLEASTLEMANLRELLGNEPLLQGSVEEQTDTPVEERVEEAAPAVEEEAAPAVEEEAAPAVEEEAAPAVEEEAAAAPEEVEEPSAIVEEEASNTEAEGAGEESEEEAAAQDEAPVEQEDSVTDDAAPAEEVEAIEEAEEEESAALSEKTEEEAQEAEEVVSEGDGGLEEEEVLEEEEEQQDVAAEEEAEETDEEVDEPLENDASPEDE